MHRARFFLTRPFSGGTVPLEADDVHHLRDVLRLGPGSVIAAVAPDGAVLELKINAVEASGIEASVIGTDASARSLPLVLCQGVSKGRKMDLVVQKATELGVAKIVPFTSERSVIRFEPARAKDRQERWQRIARESAKQCGRADIPVVNVPVDVEGLGPVLRSSASRVVLSEEAAVTLRAVLGSSSTQATVLVVGPEGGLTADEIERLEGWGATPASLGALTLRTETAAIAAVAIVAYESGSLGGTRQ